VSETRATVSEPAAPDSDPEAELVAAQQERIRLLEAALAAAKTAEPEPEAVGLHDLDEQFVAEGQGTCLECSCEQ
jgi:hypothetical protein